MGNKNQKFSGLTDEQVLSLFEQIATTANLMADICRNEAERFGEKEVSLTLHALKTMILGVGAMADMATGGSVVGDPAAWLLGPCFCPAQSCGGAA